MVGLALVTVHKAELLDKLKQNRVAHQHDYAEAAKAYRQAVIEELTTMLAAAEGGGEIQRSATAPTPQDHTEDYDRVIAMIEMSVADEIELTNQEFTQYVRDDWSWKQAFAATASYYKG